MNSQSKKELFRLLTDSEETHMVEQAKSFIQREMDRIRGVLGTKPVQKAEKTEWEQISPDVLEALLSLESYARTLFDRAYGLVV